MKKIFTGLAVAFLSSSSYAQVITQSGSNTVTAATSVACAASGVETKDNAYSRAFKLSDYGINYDYKITKIAFGVESANKPMVVNARVYKLDSGTYPTGPTTLLSSATVNVTAANNLGIVDTGTAYSQVIQNGTSFVVEIFHDGTGTGELFYMGANSGTQTGPSYLKSATCGVTTPVATGTGALASFPAKWVMTITGENFLGVTEIINSRQLQIYPNPVKEILNFKMDKGLNVESVEIYDMSGKLMPLKTSRLATSVNVSGLAKGNYILKVKGDDGQIHIQKMIKE